MRVPIEKIRANGYNPNRVSPPEMKLLIKSIIEDGYTMPVVCYYVAEDDVYEIVDGFHRYLAMITEPEIAEREQNHLPVSVIDKDISERIASTIRHNRARGTHDIDLMVDIVAKLTEAGLSDDWIMNNIGMDADELLRLKQVSGLASLFADRDFSKSWISDGDATGRGEIIFENEEGDAGMKDDFFKS
jgi:ParB-like chromosome segregation protein Spo0J